MNNSSTMQKLVIIIAHANALLYKLWNFFYFLLKEWQIVARTLIQIKGGDAIVEREGYHRNC